MNKPFTDSILSKNEIVLFVRQWGTCASDAVLDPLCSIFSVQGVKGFIGYRHEKNCFIVYGNPICAPKDWQTLTSAFQEFSFEHKASVIYLVASESFCQWAIQNNACRAFVEYGEELSIDPFDDPRQSHGVNASLVRRKCHHAEHEHVTVHEYLDKDANVEKAIEAVGDSWIKNRKGPQVHISNVYLFENRMGKRWFYAKRNNEIIGTLVLNRLEAREGWLLNHLMVTPEAPGGTPELLVITALDALRKENCHYVTFGGVPLKKIGKMQGLSLIASSLTRFVYNISSIVFHLNSRKMFWEKFHPTSEKSYLLFSQSQIGIHELFALKNALNISS